jgi:hypothetical protein
MNSCVRFVVLTSFAAIALQACGQAGSDDGWSFTYPAGDKPGSMLDLRFLNEKTAGETGYVQVSPDGYGFVRGDGKPIRFWPVCGYGFHLKSDEMAEQARFFAKMGINMVRIHAILSPKGKGKEITDFDAAEIDHIQQYVAALKKEGIYVTISPFWANGGAAGAAASWGLGYGDGEDVWGLLIFNERMQNAYKGWMRKLYLSNNPYTGIPLAKDPAVAIVQIQNEDSLLFWTFQGIKPVQKKILAGRFAEWLGEKYGSLGSARSHWQGAEQQGDDWASGTPALLDTWVLTQVQTGAMKTRADDQMAFMIDVQKGFYADITHFIRTELGYKGLVNASNWITADPVKLNDAERYTYSPTDVFAVNRYYDGGVHMGPNAGWRVDQGDFFSDTSALLAPRLLPFNLKQTVGHPMIITESGWISPLGYQAEGPLLAAAYQSLSHVQGLYWFELRYRLDVRVRDQPGREPSAFKMDAGGAADYRAVSGLGSALSLGLREGGSDRGARGADEGDAECARDSFDRGRSVVRSEPQRKRLQGGFQPGVGDRSFGVFGGAGRGEVRRRSECDGDQKRCALHRSGWEDGEEHHRRVDAGLRQRDLSSERAEGPGGGGVLVEVGRGDQAAGRHVRMQRSLCGDHGGAAGRRTDRDLGQAAGADRDGRSALGVEAGAGDTC